MTNGVVPGGVQNLFEFFRLMAARARDHGQQTIEGYVLALSTMDALCFAESGKRASGEAFDAFLMRYSGRGNIYGKVAVPLLYEELNLTKPQSYRAVLECIRREYTLDDHFRNMRIRSADEDPDWPTFWHRVNATCGAPPADALQDFRKFTYARILWRHYRTYTIHRLTVRDEAANIAGNAEPYYMNEQACCPRFDCGGIGLSCFIKPLMLHGEICHLTSEIVVEEVKRALGNSELAAPTGMVFEPVATWNEAFNWWQGYLSLAHQRHEWTLSEMVEMGWVNFGIPLPYILDTLDACIFNLAADSNGSVEKMTRMWLNYNCRLS